MTAAAAQEVVLGARHSAIALHREPVPLGVEGRVYTVEPTGDITFAHVRLGADTLVVSVSPDLHLAADAPVWLAFDQPRLHFFDHESGQAIGRKLQ